MNISITEKIVVNQDIHTTYHFFATLSNDCLWRKEINKTVVSGSLQTGVTAKEYSRLSAKRPDNLVELRSIEIIDNKIAVYESVENAPFYIKSTRQVEALSSHTTRVIYTLTFDAAIVKFALGFSIPAFLISMTAKKDMKKYLRNLKSVLESKSLSGK